MRWKASALTPDAANAVPRPENARRRLTGDFTARGCPVRARGNADRGFPQVQPPVSSEIISRPTATIVAGATGEAATPRGRLATAIGQVNEEPARRDALTQAQDRASAQSFDLYQQIGEAEGHLRQLRSTATKDLAWRFALNQDVAHGQSLAEAQATVDRLHRDQDANSELRRAMDTELLASEGRLRRYQDAVNTAVANVVLTETGNLSALFEQRTKLTPGCVV
jgi:hypothetical protein